MHIDEYERQQAHYAEFARTVAVVLTAAIKRAGGYRLQIVTHRAKDAISLRNKLIDRDVADSGTVEEDIKDLAGCRAIFYSNADVEKLLGSSLVEDNFDVLDRKAHHPGIKPDESSQLYTANHYLVALKADRLALPDFAHFAGMRCEIQLHTILNHAWAEVEHDLYKPAALAPNFGTGARKAIKGRMQGIALKYLLPAGYELDQVVRDLDRLQQGKQLFDQNPLATIVQAADNNARYAAIDSFAEHVLPLYDDPASIYLQVVQTLLQAAKAARDANPLPIQTPYGVFEGKRFEEIIELVARVLGRYRYLDVERSLQAACDLYRQARTPAEQKPVRELAQALATPQLDIWRDHGPDVQQRLVAQIGDMDDAALREDFALLTIVLEAVLGTEVRSTTASSSAITLHRGVVPGSPVLRALRVGALAQLERLFAHAHDDDERYRVFAAMGQAAQPPYGGASSRDLIAILIANTVVLIEFATKIVDEAGVELARRLEKRVHRYFTWHHTVRPDLSDDVELKALTAKVVASTARFRARLARVGELEIYKALVGFDSVFAEDWTQPDPGFKEVERLRTERAAQLLDEVNTDNFAAWLDRLERFAATKSDDLATFPKFAQFLESMATRHPDLMLAHLPQITGELARFRFKILVGLLQSCQAAATRTLLDQWLERGEHLGEVSWLLVAADGAPLELYRAVLAAAIAHDDPEAIKDVVRACAMNFATEPDAAERQAIFLAAIEELVSRGDLTWVVMGGWFSWFRSELVRALDDVAARRIAAWLVALPKVDTEADHLVGSLGLGRPQVVLEYLDQRVTYARTHEAEDYIAIPYNLHDAIEVLKTAPPADVLTVLRGWFDADDASLDYDARSLIKEVFRDFPDPFREEALRLLESELRADVLFALELLIAFEGHAPVFDLVREAVGRWGHDTEVMKSAQWTLAQEGGTSGVYGRAQALQAKQAQLQDWLKDPRESVVSFATEWLRKLDSVVADEVRRAQAMQAQRRTQFNEPPLEDGPPSPELDLE